MDRAAGKFDRMIARKSVRFSFVWIVLSMIGALSSFAYMLITADQIDQVTFLAAYTSMVPFGAIGFLGALFLFYSLFRGLAADKVIVWLRRFHRVEPARFNLATYLQELGVGSYQTTTIQDSQFQWSYMAGMTQSFGCLIGVGLLLVIPSIVGAVLVLGITHPLLHWVFGNTPTVNSIGLVISWLIAFALIFYPIAYLIIKSRGVTRLKDASQVPKIAKWAQKVMSGYGPMVPGLKIFAAGDEFWMDAVRTMLSNCDFAIIDVSDLNENMLWELSRCEDILEPQRVILAYAIPPEHYPQPPAISTFQRVEKAVGLPFAESAHWWAYPEPLPVIEGKRHIEDWLEGEVVESLEDVTTKAINAKEPVCAQATSEAPTRLRLVKND